MREQAFLQEMPGSKEMGFDRAKDVREFQVNYYI